jgi:hypothetical protein
LSTISSPIRCDCYYFDNLLYILNSNTSSTKIYSISNTNTIIDITNDLAINYLSNTFTVGKSGYGLKIFLSTDVNPTVYNSTITGSSIIKLTPSSAPSSAHVGGDPHIKPLFDDTVYIIPNTLKCYNYFDSLDASDDERFIINSKLWIIDYNFIANMINIKDDINIINNIKYNNILSTDSGFNKYISLIYKLYDKIEYLIIDMETLLQVSYDDNLVNNYKLIKTEQKYEYFNISNILESTDTYKINITINTIIFGKINIICTKYKYRKNHRNDFDIVFEYTNNLKKSSGCIVDIKTLEI